MFLNKDLLKIGKSSITGIRTEDWLPSGKINNKLKNFRFKF